jgi:hypothetical protein
MVKIPSVSDCTEFQVFVLLHLYGRQLEGMPGAIQLLTIQELVSQNITPEKLLRDSRNKFEAK